MSVVALLGDCATTTSLAIAAGWPAGDDVLVIEADPSGGSLAAWLDIPIAPSLSTVVTRVGDGGWPAIDRLSRCTPSGIRVIPAPVRSIEAHRAVDEAAASIFPAIASRRQTVALVDLGAPIAAHGVPAAGRCADVLVVVHRQATQSASAAAVRLERAVEWVEVARAAHLTVVLAVIGSAPFDPDEVARFVAADEPLTAVLLPEDPFAAAVLGGRTGVSPRRLARLPLMRAAVGAAAAMTALLHGASAPSTWSEP